MLEIFNPFGGCYIGKIDKSEFEVFEIEGKYTDFNYVKRSLFLIDDKNNIIIKDNELIKM